MNTDTSRPQSPGASRHAARSESTRAQLIQAAIQVVRDKSYQGASVFEVAKAAGLTPGAFQHHFGTKAVLMMRVVDELLDANGSAAPGWPLPDQPLAGRASQTLQLLWQRVYEPERFLVAWQVYMGCRADAQITQYIADKRLAQQQQLLQRFLGIFPELADTADTRAFLDLLLSSLRGMGLVRLFGPADASMSAQLEQLVLLLVQRCEHAPLPIPPKSPRKRS
jgi:AcrR family transcriptional regulator